MAKAKTKASNLPVPQNDAEAEQLIAQLGVLHRDQAEAQTRHDASVAALEEEHGKAVKDFQEREAAIVGGLETWASAHRERLTNGGRKKSAQLPTGEISWREGSYAVKHRPLKVEEVVLAIQERCAALDAAISDAKSRRKHREAADLTARLEICRGFIRRKLEPNKEAMIANRDLAETIRGVTVPRGPEQFTVTPLAGQISEVA